MATTTAKAFDEFKAKLELTSIQEDLNNARLSTTTGYLKNSFPASSDMPLQRARLMGSAGRGTIIRPIDDIDVLAIFENKNEIFEQYRHNSQQFIYRIRDALNKYQVEIVGTRGQAVRLFYKQKPHVDIAPVFKWRSGGYALPDGKGGWLTTDPDEHDAYIARRHSELSDRLKPLIRIFKRWNNEHSKYLKSFHLEVMVANIFTSLGSDSRDASEKLFKWAQNNITVSDPAGHSGDLSSYLSYTNRQNLMSNLEASRQRAAKANKAEREGDHEEAIRLWRIIYGDEFPAYG
jgi:hypothetical protein